MMEYDCVRAVKCFQHCDRKSNILCFELPQICPLCVRNVLCSESRIPPYCVPLPFANAKCSPCSLLIRPTNGSFLRDYENSSNLHIGVTDSQGVAYDYDEEGVHLGSSAWEQCVVIPMGEVLADLNQQQWDYALQQFSKNHRWTTDWYRENSHNCFSFVLGFLHHMGVQRILPSVASSSEFCRDQVVPRTTRAAQFISIYRQIEREGFVIQPVGSS